MSYGGQSNPPWQRNLGNTGQNLQNSMGNNTGLHFQNQIFSQQNLQQSQNLQYSHSPMGGMNQQIAASGPQPLFQQQQAISYPSPSRGSGLNNPIFSTNSSNQQSTNSHHSQQTNQNSNYNTIGTVTKLHNEFGYVDDEVFFHKNVVKNSETPKVGDRVLVEASYNLNPNTPFKWTATRIQVVPSNSGGAGPQNVGGGNMKVQRNQPPPLMGSVAKGSSGYNAVPPPNDYANQFPRNQASRRATPPSRRSPDRHSARKDTTRHREDEELERRKRREEREKEREKVRDRRDLSLEKRERSPVRRSSPKRRRARTIPRYMVRIPKILLTIKEADVLQVNNRYSNLYVPSDFFYTQVRWPESFPPHKPFSIQRPCSFHVMNKVVEPPKHLDVETPTDADYLYSAKVMLMAIPSISEIYQKCLYEERDRDDERDHVHPTRLIDFLVGTRGKNETMAIGGAWSPSLDGADPQKDPTVLIRTAIRTCKALTGIDLNGCTQWYRFLELYYRRAETSHKGSLIPARVETVVIFLPDINSCMPTRIEWDCSQSVYKAALDSVIKLGINPPSTVDNSTTSSASLATNSGGVTIGTASSSTLGASKSECLASTGNAAVVADSGRSKSDEAGNEKDDLENKREPTHYSELDPKGMKIQDLRNELEARNLPSKGLKPQLIARLVKALNSERAQQNSKDDDNEDDLDKNDKEGMDNLDESEQNIEDHVEVDMTDIVVLDEYDSTKNDDSKAKRGSPKVMDEKERQILERRYQLPDTPHIIVHPSRTAKSGKFDCTVMSLSLLLDYRPEDTKEHSFEVSLFAELFNEMLMRDFGFNIYKEIVMAPEKPKEKEDKKKDGKKSTEDKKEENDKEGQQAANKKENEDGKDENHGETEKPHERRACDADKSEKKPASSNKERERDRDRRLSKHRNHEDDTEDDDFSVKSGDKKKKQKLIIAKPDLLLSFVYFDISHCGYIFEKDVEELLYTLGLCLSRAQIRKLLAKVVSRDAFYYRKLTDKPNEDEPEASKEVKEAKDGNQQEEQISTIDLIQLAQGNLGALPTFTVKIESSDQQPPAKRLRSMVDNENEENDSNSEMVHYNGGLLDVGKLVDQMKRSEKAREETEQILIDLRKQNTDLQASNSKANSKIKDLQSDTKSLTRKLGDAEQTVSSLNKKYNEYYSILSNIHDKISPIFIKTEKHSRKESSRDSEREKERERDREKEKDKEKEDTKESIKTEVKKEDESKK